MASRAVGLVEKMLESTPPSAAVMQQNADKVLSQTKAAAETLASQFGPVKTPLGAGETIKRAAVRENIWQFMRDNWLSNTVFTSHQNIATHCCEAWNNLIDEPGKIMSLGLRQ